jgi:integrase
MVPEEKWPVLVGHERAAEWLRVWKDLGRAARTVDAYARGLAEFLEVCEREGVDPVAASRADVAVFVRVLTSRSSRHGRNVVSIDSGVGLANATLQQRLVPVRLFFDYLIEEGVRDSNPVGRGRYTPGRRFGGQQRGLVPRLTKLPWIPSEAEWLALLAGFRGESPRNRLMLALAYDAALRREELCALRTDDIDPARRMLRVRGNDEEPAGACGALFGVDRGAAGGLSAAPLDVEPGTGSAVLIGVSAQYRAAGDPVDMVEGGPPDRVGCGSAPVPHAHEPASVSD